MFFWMMLARLRVFRYFDVSVFPHFGTAAFRTREKFLTSISGSNTGPGVHQPFLRLTRIDWQGNEEANRPFTQTAPNLPPKHSDQLLR